MRALMKSDRCPYSLQQYNNETVLPCFNSDITQGCDQLKAGNTGSINNDYIVDNYMHQ